MDEHDFVEISVTRSNLIAMGFMTSMLTCVVTLILSIDLIHKKIHQKTTRSTSPRHHSRTGICQNQALKWQLISFAFYIICCMSYVFVRTNLIYGGVNNPFNYDPLSAGPYGWALFLVSYIIGKLATDISWMWRVYLTFKVCTYTQ